MSCFGKKVLGINFLPTASGGEVVLLGKLASAPAAATLSLGKAYHYFNTTEWISYWSVDAGATWIASYEPQGWQSAAVDPADVGVAGAWGIAGAVGTFASFNWGFLRMFYLYLSFTFVGVGVGSMTYNHGLLEDAGVAPGTLSGGGGAYLLQTGAAAISVPWTNPVGGGTLLFNGTTTGSGAALLTATGILYNQGI